MPKYLGKLKTNVTLETERILLNVKLTFACCCMYSLFKRSFILGSRF